jgi:hypothetical protein
MRDRSRCPIKQVSAVRVKGNSCDPVPVAVQLVRTVPLRKGQPASGAR